MTPFTMTASTRVLCLGNELLADDSFGLAVARELRAQFPGQLDLRESAASGLHLLDDVQNVRTLIVVDSIQTGTAPPGTLFVLKKDDIVSPSGGSPHYIGLFETLRLARELLLPIPEEVVILAVEVADTTTVGGRMHPAVAAAIPRAVSLVRKLMRGYTLPAAP
jgi:hydrogenase maturation protease